MRLYIGNLSYNTSDQQVKDMFAEYASTVSAQLATDKFSGNSRGFAFAELSNDEEANAAIMKLNDLEVDGRKLVVNEARPQEKKFGGSNGGGSRPYNGGNDRNRSNGGYDRSSRPQPRSDRGARY